MRHDDVTVVVTCFNYGQYLAEAVESARSEARVIVVDDGSSDPATIEALAVLPDDVDLIKQENAGVAAARNAGMARAITPYVLCLDADDRLAPDAITPLRVALERDPKLGFAYG